MLSLQCLFFSSLVVWKLKFCFNLGKWQYQQVIFVITWTLWNSTLNLWSCMSVLGTHHSKLLTVSLGTNYRFSAEELPRELVWRLVIWFTQSTRSTSTHTHTKMRRTWSCTRATLLSWTFEGEILLMVKFIYRPHTNWIPQPSKHYKYLEYSWKISIHWGY